MSLDISGGMPVGGLGGPGKVLPSEPDLRTHLDVLVRRRWWLLGPLLVGLTIAVLYLTIATPLYVVTATLKSPVTPSSTTTTLGVLTSVIGNPAVVEGGDDVDVLRSWLLQERAVALLMGHPELWRQCTLGKKVLSTFRDLPTEVRATYRAAPQVEHPPLAQLKMLRTMEVASSSSGPSIRLKVVTKHVEDGCDLLNALAAAYLLRRLEDSRTWSEIGLENIRQQLAKAEARMNATELALKEFREEHNLINAPAQASQLVSLVGTMEAEAASLRASLPSEEALLNQLTKTVEGQDARLAQARVPKLNPVVAKLESKLNDLYTQRMNLLLEYTEESTKVQALDAQIESVKKQIEEAPRQILAPLTETDGTPYGTLVGQWLQQQAKVVAMRAKLPALDRALAQARQQMQMVPSLALQLARLERDAQEEQTRYLKLRQEEIDYTMLRESEISKARVLAPARVPPWQQAQCVRPRGFMSLALGVLGGLTVGLLLALGVEYFQDVYPSLGVAEAAIGVPLLGSISLARGRRMPLMDAEDAPEWLAEEVLGAHVNISFALPGAASRAVCITSPGRAEGKTTLACNLALAEVHAGGTAVVVDCNTQAPGVHELFGLGEHPGLRDVLRGDVTLDQALHHPYQHDQLAVMPIGSDRADGRVAPAAGIIGLQTRDKKLVSLIEELRSRYSMVILDGPEASRFGDAQVLAVVSDGTVLVIVPGRTRRDSTRRAIMLLGQAGARVIGVVGNAVAGIGARES